MSVCMYVDIHKIRRFQTCTTSFLDEPVSTVTDSFLSQITVPKLAKLNIS